MAIIQIENKCVKIECDQHNFHLNEEKKKRSTKINWMQTLFDGHNRSSPKLIICW